MDFSPELEALAEFIVNTDWEDLPKSVISETKRLILDSVGCAFTGLSVDPGKMIVALAKRLGGPPESSIIGTGHKASLLAAVLANGQLINATDYDAFVAGHGAPYLIPPPLNAAEIAESSGKDLILATAVACEVATRVNNAVSSPAAFMAERVGSAYMNFGATAGVCKIFEFDRERIINALGIAGHAAQVLTWRHHNYMKRGYYPKYGLPGWQNTGAVMAALLAEMGYIGDPYVFDHEHGFWKFSGYSQWKPKEITENLGKIWKFPETVKFKRYMCCGVVSVAVDGFYDIAEKENLSPEDITAVRVYKAAAVKDQVMFSNTNIRNIVDAQFSIPYNISLAAYKVPKNAWQHINTMRDPRIQEFMKKVTVIGEFEGSKGRGLPTKVEVDACGETFIRETLVPRPMDDYELEMKFRQNAAIMLTEPKIENAVSAISNLENLKNIKELIKQITL